MAQARKPERLADSRAMVDAINKLRAKHGLRKVRHSPSLAGSARDYASYLMRRDWLGHVYPIRASSRFDRIGEVLSMHTGGRDRTGWTARRWLASPAHRSVILSSDFRWAGAGVRHGRFGGGRATIWVLQAGSLERRRRRDRQ
jgi:uncharacterized protein YkwD